MESVEGREGLEYQMYSISVRGSEDKEKEEVKYCSQIVGGGGFMQDVKFSQQVEIPKQHVSSPKEEKEEKEEKYEEGK